MATPNYLENIALIEETSRHKAEDRLAYLGGGGSTVSLPLSGRKAARLASEESQARHLADASDTAAMIDHKSLMALARERANRSITHINEQVYYLNPTLNTEYYVEALAIAEAHVKKRLENHGKIDIGGGVYMTQSSIDAIAERNVRPVLNEIAEQATAQRLADEEQRAWERAQVAADTERRRIGRAKRALALQVISEEKQASKAVRDEEKQLEREQWEAWRAQEHDRDLEKRFEWKQEEAARREQNAGSNKRIEEGHEREERPRDKLALQQVLAMTTANILDAKKTERQAQAEMAKLHTLKATAEAKTRAAKALEEDGTQMQARIEQARQEALQAQADFCSAEDRVKAAEVRRQEQEAAQAKVVRKAAATERKRHAVALGQQPSASSSTSLSSSTPPPCSGSDRTSDFRTAKESISSVDESAPNKDHGKPAAQVGNPKPALQITPIPYVANGAGVRAQNGAAAEPNDLDAQTASEGKVNWMHRFLKFKRPQKSGRSTVLPSIEASQHKASPDKKPRAVKSWRVLNRKGHEAEPEAEYFEQKPATHWKNTTPVEPSNAVET